MKRGVFYATKDEYLAARRARREAARQLKLKLAKAARERRERARLKARFAVKVSRKGPPKTTFVSGGRVESKR